MESPKPPVKVTYLMKCLISSPIMEMNLLNTDANHQTILTQKMMNKEISLLLAETLIVPQEDPLDQIVVEMIETTLRIIVDPEVMTMIEGKTNVKIEEILILKLSLKSTSPESIEIKVKRILRINSRNSERLKISL